MDRAQGWSAAMVCRSLLLAGASGRLAAQDPGAVHVFGFILVELRH